ncbi:S-layer homology domain-containing protein, partial [Paenibacillus endophyticus]
MLASILPIVNAESAADDSTAHWGEKSLVKWIDKGMLGGYPDGSIQPDRQVTRAEFTKLVNAVFRLNKSEASSFTDVVADAWYSQDIAAVKEAGFIEGYPDGSFKPGASISRQEAAKIASGLFKLEVAQGDKLASFKDRDQVQAYAKSSLEQLLAGGYINGYPDQTLRPAKPITRAEAIALLDRLAVEVVNKAGSYDKVRISGNAVINAAGVRLNDAVIDGNLFLTQGIGEGDVFLTDLEVKGTVYIQGGGVNSIHFINSKLNKLNINKATGKVRVLFSNKTDAEQLTIESTAQLELDAAARLSLLQIEETAVGTNVNAKGNVKQIINEGADIVVNDKKLGLGDKAVIQNGVLISGQQATPGQGGGGTGATPTPAPTTEPTT